MCEALADTRVLGIQYRPMEIGIHLLSLTLSFSPAQLYKHAVYTVSFGRQTEPVAGEDGNHRSIKHWCERTEFTLWIPLE